jgi:hypothetical protein
LPGKKEGQKLRNSEIYNRYNIINRFIGKDSGGSGNGSD